MDTEKQAADFEYQVLTTADGSPSLRLWKEHQAPEAMHHLGGALAETMYIYDSAIRATFEKIGSLKVLSVGLGLGYNEILAAARAYVFGTDLRLESFESEDLLRNSFLDWVQDHHSPEPFRSTYDKILSLISHELGVLPDQIKSILQESEQNGTWKLRGRLEQTTEFGTKFNCILFDAFSRGSTPDLWTEDFLQGFLRKAADPQCIFSTYACTGTLKRSLLSEGFRVEFRPGFAGKRQSTWAVKT